MRKEAKRSFTPWEVNEICRLLLEKVRAAPEVQKMIRAKIRNLGFYVSDFRASADGFTASDFERLIHQGRIFVIGTGHGEKING